MAQEGTKILGYIPLFKKLDIVFADIQERGKYWSVPALALAVAKEPGFAALFFYPIYLNDPTSKGIEMENGEDDQAIAYDDGRLDQEELTKLAQECFDMFEKREKDRLEKRKKAEGAKK